MVQILPAHLAQGQGLAPILLPSWISKSSSCGRGGLEPHPRPLGHRLRSKRPPAPPRRAPAQALETETAKVIAKRERERLKLQDKIRREQLEKFREQQNADAEMGEVRGAGRGGAAGHSLLFRSGSRRLFPARKPRKTHTRVLFSTGHPLLRPAPPRAGGPRQEAAAVPAEAGRGVPALCARLGGEGEEEEARRPARRLHRGAGGRGCGAGRGAAGAARHLAAGIAGGWRGSWAAAGYVEKVEGQPQAATQPPPTLHCPPARPPARLPAELLRDEDANGDAVPHRLSVQPSIVTGKMREYQVQASDLAYGKGAAALVSSSTWRSTSQERHGNPDEAQQSGSRDGTSSKLCLSGVS